MKLAERAGLWFLAAAVGLLVLPGAVRRAEAVPVGWYGSQLCEDGERFECVTVGGQVVEREVRTRRGTKVVKQEVAPTWEEVWPEEREREIVMKLNRINYRLRAGFQVAVPKDLASKSLIDYSPFPRVIEPPGEKLLIIDLSIYAFAAYDAEGNLVRWGPAVGGRAGHRTPTGKYRIYSKGGPGCRSSKYPEGCSGRNCAPMPYCMAFKGNYFIHGGSLPGRHQSHGCVRLFTEDAKWLNQEFVNRGTRVIVKPYGDSQ